MGVSSLGLNGRRVGLHKLLSVSDERTSALRFSGSKRDGLHSTHFAPPGLVTINTRSGQCAAAPLAVAWSGGIVVCDKSNPPGSFIMDGKAFLIFGTAISILAAVPAHAAQLEFDCDVPADRFSSVSQDVANGGSVSGTIRVDKMREGNNSPVAGAGIFGPEKRAIAAFHLIASDARAKNFDIIFFVTHGGDLKEGKVGEVGASTAIEFNISLSAVGKAILTVNGAQFQADATAISGGRAMAFCSTAQFEFTNLIFSASGEGGGG